MTPRRLRRPLRVGLGAVALCLGGACAAPAGPAASATAADVPLGVAQVLAHASAWQGRTLVVNGAFAGWTGPCKGAPPRTRSDWMLTEANACLYVTGPVPAGLTPPPDIVSNGRPVQLRARLERADDGRPYLVVVPQ